jgi:hypothetical protein
VRAFKRAGGTVVSDDFNRANSNSLGSGWTESESNAGALTIASNKLTLNHAGSARQGIALRTETFGNNQLASIRSVVIPGTNAAQLGIGVRMSGAYDNFTGYGVIVWTAATPRVFRLYKFVNANLSTGSGATLLQSWTPARTDDIDDDDTTIEIRAEGTSIEVFFYSDTAENHGRQLSATDSDIASGVPGLINYTSVFAAVGDTTADDFYARDF